jgi:xylulose-5-phosphate/fructose-6-phosphate phosphoketolase
MEHEQYIARYGDDMPEIGNWTWGRAAASGPARSTEADNV